MPTFSSPQIFLFFSLVAIAAGPLLFFLTEHNRHLWNVLDSFVLVTIGALVLFHIIPQSIEMIGWSAVLIMLLTFFLPMIFEGLKKIAQTTHNITLFLALVGVMLHNFGDGMALVTPLHLEDAEALPMAIILHQIPIGMTIWWLLHPKLGTKISVFVISLIIVATIGGYVFGQNLFADLSSYWLGVFEAIMGGALLHVVIHSHQHHKHHEKSWQWSAGIGTILGLIGFLLFHQMYNHEALFDQNKVSQIFFDLALQSAPALFIAYLISGALEIFLPKAPTKWLSRGSDSLQALKGMTFGLPLPICSCGVLPVYRALVLKGIPIASGIAFLVATPELSVEAFIISVPLLGGKMAVIRLFFAATLAMLVGILMAKFYKKFKTKNSPNLNGTEPQTYSHLSLKQKIWTGLRYGLGNNFDETAPWILLGLTAAAFFSPLLHVSDFFRTLPDFIEIPLFALIGMPVYVCASGATPLVAVLLLSGVSPGAALAFLMTGPATNITTFGLLKQLYNKKMALLFAVTMAILASLMGIVLNFFIPEIAIPDFHEHKHEVWTTIQKTSLIFLSGFFLLSLFRKGPRYMIQKIIASNEVGHGVKEKILEKKTDDCCHS